MKNLTIALLILLSLGTGSAIASQTWQGNVLQVADSSQGINLDQAVERVRKQTGGRILSAETVTRNGQRVHRIKVLTPDHRVVIREIPAGGH